MESSEEKVVEVQTDRVPVLNCSKCGCEIDVADLEPFVRVECPDCNNIETVPAKLGPFLLLNLLGTGGMGGVYYAKDESLGRFVAIKVMLKSIGEDKAFVESFKREAQAIARLNHPNIVQIYSFGQEKGQPFIVMELVSGQRFDKMVESKKALDQALVMRIGLDVAEGLKAADEAGLLHGDIKPENILLDEKMKSKIVDFGIASFANQQQDGIWGTPYYIAPEKIRRQKADCRSDIYSLGATLFHALTGHPPFEGKTPIDVVKARLQHPAPLLHTARPNIDPFVEKIVARMLEQDPLRRYPNYNSLISDMRKAVQQLGAPGAVSGFAAEISKKTGKVYVSKKHTGPVSQGGGMGADIPPPQPTRLVIHKRPGSSTTGSFAPPPVTSEMLADQRKKTTEARLKRGMSKGTKKAIWATVWIVIVLSLIGGGIGIFLHFKNKKENELTEKREGFNLKSERTRADDLYRNKILMTTSNVIALAARIQGYPDQATDAVLAVLKEPLDLPPPEPPPEAAPEATPAPEAAPAKTEGKAEAPPAPKAEAQAETPPAAKPDKAAPAAEKAPEAPKPEVAPEPPAPPKPPEPPANEPEIKKVTRRVIAGAAKAQAHANTARVIQNESYKLLKEALDSRKAATAGAKVKMLTAQHAQAQALEQETRELVDNAGKDLKRVMEIKTEDDTKNAAARKADEEARKAAEAAEAAAKKDEELRNLVEKEKKMVETAHAGLQPMIVQHRYKEVLDTLKGQMIDYTTDEGKATFKVLVDRATRLNSLKAFLVERLNAEPFKWGYDLGPGNSVDVEGADDTSVKIKGRAIAWTSVSAVQMWKFIDHCLQAEKITVRIRGEQTLNAAVFCYENAKAKKAADLAQKAADLCPDLQAEAKRLMPDL